MALQYGRCDGELIEFQWDVSVSKVTKRPSGKSGWAYITRRSGGVILSPPQWRRIHFCANNPCTAVWPASKYGHNPVPVHLQPAAWSAELEALAAATALGGSSSTESAPAPLLEPAFGIPEEPTDAPLEAVPAAVMPPEADGVGDVGEDAAKAPAVAAVADEPTLAPLRPRIIAPPVEVAKPAAVAAAIASAPLASLPAHAAHRVLDKLLALAREIRRPRNHVGYSAFAIFALMKRMRIFMWEGASRVDIVHTFAPWALEACTGEAMCDGVCCCIPAAVAASSCNWMPVSAETPLSTCNHFVGGVALGTEVLTDDDSLEGFYCKMGIAIIGSVADGDCGIDTMCMMAGLPQNSQQRDALREDWRTGVVDMGS